MEMEIAEAKCATPKSARFSRRRSLFPHLEDSAKSPRIGKTPGDSPSGKKLTPLALRLEDENEAISPIKKATFYGRSSTSAFDPKKRAKSSSRSPPKKERKENTKPVTSAKKSEKKYGINKGVSHAIKKPKTQKKEPLEATPKFKLTTCQAKTPQIAGKRSSGNMAYEIKNGEPSFKILETPKSKPYFEKAPYYSGTPKTPKTLFTPSSKSDFMDDLLVSPPKRSRRHALPSPVKICKDDNHNEKIADLSTTDHDENDDGEHEEPDECIDQIEKFIEEHKTKDDSLAAEAEGLGDLQLELEDLQEEKVSEPEDPEIVEKFSDGFITKVRDFDCNKHATLESALKAAGMKHDDKATIYAFKIGSEVVGILLSELLTENDRVYRAGKVKNSNEWNMVEVLSRVSVGISDIWVHEQHQRKGIASRLVTAMEDTFFSHKKLNKGQEYAFAHKSGEGAMFASKYVGHPQGYFLSYSPK